MWTCIWFLQRTRTYGINDRCEWNHSLPSVFCGWWSFNSTIDYLRSPFQPVTLLACSLDARLCMPAVIMDTVLFKVLYWKIHNVFFTSVFVFLCIIHVKSIINLLHVQHYIADCVSWVPRLTLSDLEQIILMNMLSEWNSFIWRGLTISPVYMVHYVKNPSWME